MLLVIIQDQVEQFRTGNRAKVELMLLYLMKAFLSELLNHKYSHHDAFKQWIPAYQYPK